MEAHFPEDWRLEVAIWDRGVIEYADQLIGATVIDIENRLHSNLLYKNNAAIRLEQQINADQIEDNKSNKNKKDKKKKNQELNRRKDELKKALQRTKAI